ncbi:MAG TPA: WYL domain-containing protein [Anaerolineaceae bacterium]|nr:WYL domain-containing protein [Anaerolineaceae bacterium]
MRLHRLIAILLLLEARGQVKARELAEALETSERTVYRDIETLCEAGVPIAALAGPLGGFSLMPGYSVNPKDLHADDIINLFLSGIGVRPEEHSEASLNLKTTLLKLEKSVPGQYLPEIRMARERFYFDPSLWFDEKPALNYLDTLRKSVWTSQKVRLVHTKSSEDSGETTVRTVRPYGLVVKNTDWYLVAYCETRQDIRVFKCDRVRMAELLEERFSYPEGFNLEEFWHGWVRGFKDRVRGNEDRLDSEDRERQQRRQDG